MVKVHAFEDEFIDVSAKNAAVVGKDVLRQAERDTEAHKAKPPGLAWRKCGKKFLHTWSSTVQDAVGLTGIKYVVNSESRQLRRWVWTIAILVGSIAVIYQMQERYALFSSVAKSVDFQIEYPASLAFPAVTICNFNTYRNLDLDQQPFGRMLADINSFETFGAVNYSAYEPLLRGVNMTALILQYGHNMSYGNMFEKGLWGYNETLYPVNFSSVLTDAGLCFTFNDGQNDRPPLSVKSAGKGNGLSLLLNLEQDLYFYSSSGGISAGILVAVHEKGKVPVMRSVGISLAPGTEARISLRKKQTSIEVTVQGTFEKFFVLIPEIYCYDIIVIKNLDDIGDCGTKDLKYFNSYTLDNCRREYQIQIQLENCGCVLPHAAVHKDLRVCDPYELFTCIYQYQAIPEHFIICDCPIECEITKFIPKLSLASYPSEFLSDFFAQNDPSFSKEHFKNNMVKVEVYMEDIAVETITQQRAYDFFEFLCDSGCAMGLWLGGSILTIVEILDHLHQCVLIQMSTK